MASSKLHYVECDINVARERREEAIPDSFHGPVSMRNTQAKFVTLLTYYRADMRRFHDVWVEKVRSGLGKHLARPEQQNVSSQSLEYPKRPLTKIVPCLH